MCSFFLLLFLCKLFESQKSRFYKTQGWEKKSRVFSRARAREHVCAYAYTHTQAHSHANASNFELVKYTAAGARCITIQFWIVVPSPMTDK